MTHVYEIKCCICGQESRIEITPNPIHVTTDKDTQTHDVSGTVCRHVAENLDKLMTGK